MPKGLYKVKGSDVWHILIEREGFRVRRSSGTTSAKDAQRIRDEILADLRRAVAPSAAGTWQEACIKWLKEKPRSSSDRYTLAALRYAERPLSEVTPESFKPALAHLSPSTYNRYRSLLVAICNLSGHPLKLEPKGGKNARLRFLTADEWERLYAALPPHLKAPALFSIKTGLRQANVLGLRWDQIDLRGGRMWIHGDEAKGGKAIGLRLAPDAIEVLRGQLGQSAKWVFPYKGRGRRKAEAGKEKPIGKVKTAWQLAMERAGLGYFERWTDDKGKPHKKWHGDFTWHGLRHTWASWHLMAGTPIEVLAELGGWEDLRMVQKHYGHLASDHLAHYAGNAKPWSPEKSVVPTTMNPTPNNPPTVSKQ